MKTSNFVQLVVWVAMLGLFFAGRWRSEPVEESVSKSAGSGIIYVYFGAAAGIIAGYLAGLIVGYLPDSALFVIGCPVALVVILVLDGWVRRGHWDWQLPAIAVAALLVNLLAAGGIGQIGNIDHLHFGSASLRGRSGLLYESQDSQAGAGFDAGHSRGLG